jgi:hypothetical protein
MRVFEAAASLMRALDAFVEHCAPSSRISQRRITITLGTVPACRITRNILERFHLIPRFMAEPQLYPDAVVGLEFGYR